MRFKLFLLWGILACTQTIQAQLKPNLADSFLLFVQANKAKHLYT